MALEENPNVVEFEMSEDVYTLSRKKDGNVHLIIDGQTVKKDVSSARIDLESGALKLMGREMGKINREVTQNVETVAERFINWFPPGLVKHAHSMSDFDGHKGSGLVVGKFSATWCGPCKMVAPLIDRMSLEYPNVTFIHVDEHDAKNLFQREKIQSYPTFKFWFDGQEVGEKVEGADVAAIESSIRSLGAEKVEIQKNETEEIAEEEFTLTCERDVFKLEKMEAGVALSVNGKQQAAPGKAPRVEIDVKTGKVSIGRGGGQIYVDGGADLEAMAQILTEWFPTQVQHISNSAEFDDVVKSGIVVAKFSAEWCGPCKQIAGFYHDISNKLKGKVTFLHIDVDEATALKNREQIEAMPTFDFWKDGQKMADKRVRGVDIQRLMMNLMTMGVDLSEVMNN